MPLKDIEAICIDTRDINLAVAAATRMREAGVGNIKILTDEDGITIARRADFNATVIQKLETIDAYSKFMIEQVHEHVTSDHFLVFQWDGFVINPHLWWDGFLEYDYIGAPWPQPYRPAPDLKVGNGGFSLRSRRLSATLSKLHAAYMGEPEDVFIAHQIQSNPILAEFSLAPVQIARHFSVEHQSYLPPTDKDGSIPNAGALGFHGWFNFHFAYDDTALISLVSERLTKHQRNRILKSWSNTALLVNLCNNDREEAALQIARIAAQEFALTVDEAPERYVASVIEALNHLNGN